MDLPSFPHVNLFAAGVNALNGALNQSQGETRRVNAVGLTEAEHAARPCDGRLAQDLEVG
jgi:hypothetical protein